MIEFVTLTFFLATVVLAVFYIIALIRRKYTLMEYLAPIIALFITVSCILGYMLELEMKLEYRSKLTQLERNILGTLSTIHFITGLIIMVKHLR